MLYAVNKCAGFEALTAADLDGEIDAVQGNHRPRRRGAERRHAQRRPRRSRGVRSVERREDVPVSFRHLLFFPPRQLLRAAAHGRAWSQKVAESRTESQQKKMPSQKKMHHNIQDLANPTSAGQRMGPWGDHISGSISRQCNGQQAAGAPAPAPDGQRAQLRARASGTLHLRCITAPTSLHQRPHIPPRSLTYSQTRVRRLLCRRPADHAPKRRLTASFPSMRAAVWC